MTTITTSTYRKICYASVKAGIESGVKCISHWINPFDDTLDMPASVGETPDVSKRGLWNLLNRDFSTSQKLDDALVALEAVRPRISAWLLDPEDLAAFNVLLDDIRNRSLYNKAPACRIVA